MKACLVLFVFALAFAFDVASADAQVVPVRLAPRQAARSRDPILRLRGNQFLQFFDTGGLIVTVAGFSIDLPNGTVSPGELWAGLQNRSPGFAFQQAQNIFAQMDTNADGLITRGDFVP